MLEPKFGCKWLTSKAQSRAELEDSTPSLLPEVRTEQLAQVFPRLDGPLSGRREGLCAPPARAVGARLNLPVARDPHRQMPLRAPRCSARHDRRCALHASTTIRYRATKLLSNTARATTHYSHTLLQLVPCAILRCTSSDDTPSFYAMPPHLHRTASMPPARSLHQLLVITLLGIHEARYTASAA